uniref:CSON014590 protein n=1 Tax=Culicoides sonorensis TaxID=179676 RepID=A0A336MAY2_CULSO
MWTVTLILYTITLVFFILLYKKYVKKLFNELIKNFNIKLRNGEKDVNFNDHKYIEENLKDVSDICGPRSVPFLGTTWIYFWKYKMTKIHEVYKDLHETYGPIVVERTGSGFPIVSLYDRDDIDKVLRYPSKYPFRPPTEIIAFYRKSRPDRYASVGLPNAQGQEWEHLRSNLTGGLTNRKTLLAFLPTLNIICDDFIELIRHKRDMNGVIENFQDIANLMGLETVCCLMLGRRIGYLSKDFKDERFMALATAVKRLFILQRDAYFGNGLWKYIPTTTYKEFAKTEDIIYNIISEIVNETRNENLDCQTDDIKNIFLDILKNQDLDIRDRIAGIIDFIAAGIETLAHTLSFFFYFITQNDSFQNQIYDEFSYCGSEIDIEALTNAHFTKACIHESYRLCPTAFCIARILEDDFILSDYKLKAGTFVLCQTAVACQDDQNFKNAKQFIPQRWMDGNKFNVNKGGVGANLVLPFGIGKRTCPGKKYIEIELNLVIAKLLKEFKVEFVGELETVFEFLIAPKTPVNVRFTDRETI